MQTESAHNHYWIRDAYTFGLPIGIVTGEDLTCCKATSTALLPPMMFGSDVAAAATVRPSKKGTSQHVLIIYM